MSIGIDNPLSLYSAMNARTQPLVSHRSLKANCAFADSIRQGGIDKDRYRAATRLRLLFEAPPAVTWFFGRLSRGDNAPTLGNICRNPQSFRELIGHLRLSPAVLNSTVRSSAQPSTPRPTESLW